MRSQVDLIEHRLGHLEQRVVKIEDKSDPTQLQQVKMSNRAKVIVALLGLLGIVASSVTTYYATRNSPSPPPAPASID